MGKKNRRSKISPPGGAAVKENTLPRNIIRETLEITRLLGEKCTAPFGSGAASEWDDFQEVYDIVQQLRIKQSKYVDALPDDREASIADLQEWVEGHDVNTESIRIVSTPERGFALEAKKPLSMTNLFLEIPRKLMLTTDNALDSALGPLIKADRILQAMPNVVLALFLLCERRDPNSFWKPYLNSLPRDYNIPLYFTAEEIKKLKGSPVYGEAMNQWRNIGRQYAYFFKLFQVYVDSEKLPIRAFCYDDYRWAVATVMTRQNQVPAVTERGTISALIPLWDMCNHANGQLSTDFSVEKDCSQCFAQDDFASGSEIFIFYGPRPNSELLLHSGFVYPPNEHDRLSIRLGISKDDRLYERKLQLLARIAINPSKEFALHGSGEPVGSELLLFLRVFSMSGDELDTCLADGFHTSQIRDFDTLVSVENERKAWSFLQTRASLLLRAYPSSLEEDEQRLAAGGLSEHEQLILQLHMCEKRILTTSVAYASAMCKVQVEKVKSRVGDPLPERDYKKIEELEDEVDNIELL